MNKFGYKPVWKADNCFSNHNQYTNEYVLDKEKYFKNHLINIRTQCHCMKHTGQMKISLPGSQCGYKTHSFLMVLPKYQLKVSCSTVYPTPLPHAWFFIGLLTILYKRRFLSAFKMLADLMTWELSLLQLSFSSYCHSLFK